MDNQLEEMFEKMDDGTCENYYGFDFKLTCPICPEQYDVFYNGKYVAYVRKRYGHLTVYHVDNHEVMWDVGPFYCSNEGDSYSGTIENRKVHFKKITDLLKEYLSIKKDDKRRKKSKKV